MLLSAKECQVLAEPPLAPSARIAGMAKRKKNPHAVALGRMGGKAAAGAGFKILNARRTPEEREAIARHAAQVRWARTKKSRAKQ